MRGISSRCGRASGVACWCSGWAWRCSGRTRSRGGRTRRGRGCMRCWCRSALTLLCLHQLGQYEYEKNRGQQPDKGLSHFATKLHRGLLFRFGVPQGACAVTTSAARVTPTPKRPLWPEASARRKTVTRKKQQSPATSCIGYTPGTPKNKPKKTSFRALIPGLRRDRDLHRTFLPVAAAVLPVVHSRACVGCVPAAHRVRHLLHIA